MTIFPFHAFLAFFGLAIPWAASLIMLTGIDTKSPSFHRTPLAPWRRALIKYAMRYGCRLICIGLGFIPVYGTKIRDLRTNRRHSPILIANHVAMIDILVICAYYDDVPSFIARKGVEGAPMVGRCATAIQCIYIGEGISGTSEEIRKRTQANDPGVPPLLIFPEYVPQLYIQTN